MFHLLAILIVDAPLTEVYLNRKGETVINETEISILSTRLPWRDRFSHSVPVLIIRSSLVGEFGVDFKKFLQKVVDRRPETDAYLEKAIPRRV
jgi:hypothetical protein